MSKKENQNKISVIGCSGLVGSSIVRCALEKGYIVNGTMRNIKDDTKLKYLKMLKNSENLELFKADMSVLSDFDNCLQDVSTLFIASLIYQLKMFKVNKPQTCLAAFKINNLTGFLIFIFIFSFNPHL